jgi:hypothetical protein
MAWWLAAAGGALAAALAGWVIVAAFVAWGQLAGAGELTGTAFLLSTQFWLLAHGGPLTRDGVTITLVPLGLTALLALLLHSVGVYAGRQAKLARPDAAPQALTARVAAVLGVSYGLVATIATTFLAAPGTVPVAGLGALLLAFVLGGFGARSATGWRPQRSWPAWAQVLPRAVATAVVVLLLGGLVATGTGLIAHRDLVTGMFERMTPGASGAILLALLQLAFLGNVVIWGATWTTGAGFSLGGDSVVVLTGHYVNALPSVPLIGVLPVASPAPWYSVLWIAWGVAAGAAAAWIVVRARPRARFDETALVGGAAGIGSGLVFALVSLLSRGDLGADRMAGLGPLFPETLILTVTVLGFSGLAAGLVLGLLRPPRESSAGGPPAAKPVWHDPGGAEFDDEPAAPDPGEAPDGSEAVEGPEGVEPAEPVAPDGDSAAEPAAAASPGSPAAPPERRRKVRVHFGPHNVTDPVEGPAELTDALADTGPIEEDSGSLDFTVAMTAPFHEMTGGRRAPRPELDP